MKNSRIIVAAAVLCSGTLRSQVLNNAGGDHWLTNPRSFTVGNNFVIPFEALLNIRGDLFPALNLSGETFRSTSADGFQGNTRFWRHAASWDPVTPFHELGRIFHNIGSVANPNNGFNIQADKSARHVEPDGQAELRLVRNLLRTNSGGLGADRSHNA